MADRVVLQVAQTKFDDQAFLRQLGERRQGANMDCHLYLSARPYHQKASKLGGFSTDFTESYRGQYV